MTRIEFEIKTLPFDPHRLDGLSERIVASHHANNYGGAVKRLNAIRALVAAADFRTIPGFALTGLKPEELIAANSVLLHELHFACLGGDGVLPDGPLQTALAQAFGSVERWRAEFVALGRALAGGSGWALLSWSPRAAQLVTQWASDHGHALADAVPLVALDMYEHAYHMDFGARAADWVDVFMRNIDWARTAEKFEAAVAASTTALEVSPQLLAAQLAQPAAQVQLIDVRRRPVHAAATSRLPNATWHDPEQLDLWSAALDRSKLVAVYCVPSHGISHVAAARLARGGLDVHYVSGGIERWALEGRPLAAKT